MTSTQTQAQAQTQTTTTKAEAQRAARKRFSFGEVWNAAVMTGKVTDKNKLVAQAVKLKAGRKYDLNKLKFETLLAKVQKALATQTTAE